MVRNTFKEVVRTTIEQKGNVILVATMIEKHLATLFGITVTGKLFQARRKHGVPNV